MAFARQETGRRRLTKGMSRQGITPIVAIVLLIFLVVIVVSGFAMFLDDMLESQWDEIRNQAYTEVQFRHLACNDHPNQGDTIEFVMKNTGDTNIDTTRVDVYVRGVSDGRLIDMLSASGQQLSPGDHWRETLTLGSADFGSGRAYLIEIEFTSNGGTNTIHQCTARRVLG